MFFSCGFVCVCFFSCGFVCVCFLLVFFFSSRGFVCLCSPSCGCVCFFLLVGVSVFFYLWACLYFFLLVNFFLAFSVHQPNRLGSFSTISAAAATAETAITAESFPKILVCLLTVGQSISVFINKNSSQYFPSFVIVVTIIATISDEHVLTIRGFYFPIMVCWSISYIYLNCKNIQLQVIKCCSTLQPQMTCLQMS